MRLTIWAKSLSLVTITAPASLAASNIILSVAPSIPILQLDGLLLQNYRLSTTPLGAKFGHQPTRSSGYHRMVNALAGKLQAR